MDLWHWIVAGRTMMVPIAVASFIGLAVIIERLFVLRRSRIIVPELAAAIDMLSGTRDLSAAYTLCQGRPGPFANIVKSGLDHAESDWTVIRDVLQETGRREATLLTRRLGVLETVAAISPLMGLLGTVLGMIRIFAAVSSAGVGNPEALSGGISEAMVTTAAGLFIGIPALVAYNALDARADRLIFDLETYASKLLDALRRRQQEANSAAARA
jgi:biopolymer transport protein ExbB